MVRRLSYVIYILTNERQPSHSDILKVILPMIIPLLSHIQQSPTICITIDNVSNNTVGGSCHSAHNVESRFAVHHIDMVSCVHCKCQARAGVLRFVGH